MILFVGISSGLFKLTSWYRGNAYIRNVDESREQNEWFSLIIEMEFSMEIYAKK